eukprot:CAMPEP_0114588516 /NCGR_PEP_ID=MMETSP0125-20121206/11196_1 /TAXON_ID=485358 ORGANISM="Aristerostoma sp., Strain ATCC 50986" /NCGR_SAMPLE_ID=MMETSP0125 /ASSEMBLY_ACC=CAM_ASM_000245 /LENGTH=33 /DNA_ID= /DNA_START= /DNA_END= /DNA_ORIENTATION=
MSKDDTSEDVNGVMDSKSQEHEGGEGSSYDAYI